MNITELTEITTGIVAEVLDVAKAELAHDTYYITDLKADYLELIELAVELEKEFGVNIQDKDMSKMQSFGQTIACLEQKVILQN